MTKNAQEVFDAHLEGWLFEERTWSRKIRDFLWSRYHAWRPSRLSFLAVLHQTSRALVAASPPLVLLLYGTLNLRQAGAAFAALLVGQAIVGWLGGLRRAELARREWIGSSVWVQVGDLLGSLGVQPEDPERRNRRVEACLGLKEASARQIADPVEGKISVTVATYDDPHHATMTVRFRNPGNERPRGRQVADLRGILGHHVCEAAVGPVAVDEIRRFGPIAQTSPTNHPVGYRSFMIFPLQLRDQHQGFEKLGFVSVDAPHPFAFHGNRGEQLVVHCEAIIAYIALEMGRF